MSIAGFRWCCISELSRTRIFFNFASSVMSPALFSTYAYEYDHAHLAQLGSSNGAELLTCGRCMHHKGLLSIMDLVLVQNATPIEKPSRIYKYRITVHLDIHKIYTSYDHSPHAILTPSIPLLFVASCVER